MTTPLPAQGDTSWSDWGQFVHTRVTTDLDGKIDAEQARDTIAAALRAGANVTITPDDVADTITIAAAAGTTPDATTTAKGVVQLAGDLGGTAAAPTVPGLSGKAASAHTHPVADLTATGTRSATTVLHGDNTWKAAATGGTKGVRYTAIWDGTNYIDQSDGTTVTASTDRPTGAFFVFLGGPDPNASGLMVNGDEWKDAV